MTKTIITTIIILIIVVVIVFIISRWEESVKRKTIDSLTKEFEKKLEGITEGQEILMSQIQPHFIYNVLNTIKYFCKNNPNEALIVIDKFSLFLRKIMDVFSSKECIPLEQEMDIVKNYVYLEKCRFGDKVDVIYDIQSTDFNVPPLSIQPMVENAIKHGITKKMGGGQVWVKTYEDSENNYVEIRDNGVGFYVGGPEKIDGKSHIGIKNTSKRIEVMSLGELNIESEPGRITKVLIRLPKNVS